MMENVPYIDDIPCGMWATKESLIEEKDRLHSENRILRQQVTNLTKQLDLAVEALHNCYGTDEDGVEYINYSVINSVLATINKNQLKDKQNGTDDIAR